jgi:zinc D-Ala-D-Ala carboxypeptidase
MRFPKQTKNDGSATAIVNRFGNKLDEFRTYSYYHVVALCSTQHLSKIAPVFENEVLFKELLNKPTPKDEFGYRTPSYVGNVQDEEHKFYILTNGIQDVDIMVEQLLTETTVANPKIATGTEALQTLTGQVVFREPLGIKMLSIYRLACLGLNTVAQDVRVIIKTIFIGETDSRDGRPSQVGYVLDTPAIYGTITQFKVSVNEQGSLYTADLLNIVGGLALDPNLTSSASGQLVRGAGSLKDMLTHLAQQYTDDAANNLKQLDPEVAKGKVPVQYEIRIHDSIKKIESWTTTGERNARTGTSGGAQPTTIPANVSLEGAIATIFNSCKQYLDQAAKNPALDAFFYRVVASLDSTTTETKAVFTIIPTYFNRQQELVKKMRKEDDPEDALADVKTVVIYDYIFTGHNTDIESFDMQIDEGMGYFSSVTNIQTLSNDYRGGDSVTKATTPAADVATPDGSDVNGQYGSVGTSTGSTQQTSGNEGLSNAKEAYDVTLDRTWAIGAAKTAAIVRTRGHTGWFKQFAINPYQAQDVADALFIDIPDVYLNIMMPSSASGLVPSGSREQKFEKFWFKGLWKVQTIKNNFVDGVFSTELEMLAINLNPVAVNASTNETTSNPVPETRDSATTPPIPVNPSTPFVSGSTNGKFAIATTSSDTKLTKDFVLRHFTATSKVPAGQNNPASQDILDNIANVATVLQYIKDQLDLPVTVSSGYRNPVVNKAVGGAADSDHMKGEAVDFQSTKWKPKQIVDAIIALKVPFKQLILEEPPGRNPWVHIAVSRNPSSNKNQVLHYMGGKYLPYKG